METSAPTPTPVINSFASALEALRNRAFSEALSKKGNDHTILAQRIELALEFAKRRNL